MKCPYCGGILGARCTYKDNPFKIRRRRECKSCGSVIYTLEVFEKEGLINGGEEKEAVKQNGEEEERGA